MEISPKKCEKMAFLRQDPVICKIFVENKCLQQVRNFKYLGCEISYGNEKIFNKNWQNLLKYWELKQHF
jgi:hypothetical protein